MIGVGVLRAYRLGRVIHVPALLYNRTYNKQWGIEALLPARATIRYNASKKTILTTGYDLEGTQYAFNTSNVPLTSSYVQRGEIKPKLGLETYVSKKLRFTAQTGVRIMSRLNWASDYVGNNLLVETNAKPSLYATIGLHVLSVTKPKQKK